jgi:hypothetical protein
MWLRRKMYFNVVEQHPNLTGLLSFGALPIVSYSKTHKEHNVSETGSGSIVT